MATIPAPPRRPTRRGERSWRSGVARTFASLFLAIVVLLFLLGGRLFYDAFVPLAADSDQVLVGSVFVTVALLLGVFMTQGRRQTVRIGRALP